VRQVRTLSDEEPSPEMRGAALLAELNAHRVVVPPKRRLLGRTRAQNAGEAAMVRAMLAGWSPPTPPPRPRTLLDRLLRR
jgi:hypothetical protein